MNLPELSSHRRPAKPAIQRKKWSAVSSSSYGSTFAGRLRSLQLDFSAVLTQLSLMVRLHFTMVALLFVAMAFISTGCQTTERHVAWYDGPPKGTNEIALLKIQKDPRAGILCVDKIDGQLLTRGKPIGNGTCEIELLPGQHDLDVSYQDLDKHHSITDAKIDFEAETGKNYELHGAPGDRSFGKEFKQDLFREDWYWTVWILDAQTKKVVAGVPRTTPMHWYE
jgi:hypothetical protein